MKVNVSNLGEALALRLDELLDAEKQLKETIPDCINKVSSVSLKLELKEYLDMCVNKIQKLERVYTYLMKSPTKSKTKIINRLIENTRDMLGSPLTNEMRDVLLISCLQTINHFKMAGYKTALTFASELELETAAELLEQVLHWEMETEKNLSSIAVNEVNTKTF
jgi:ferritin-like metal-binding protein YciE